LEKVVYMQDVTAETMEISVYQEIVVQPEDLLKIVVSGNTPELRIDSTYRVDAGGYIDFPKIDRFQATGLTREQLSAMIKKKIEDHDGYKDAVVTTEFENFKISVFGEVRHQGTFTFEDDRVTIADAIRKAGDVTGSGRKENVVVMRKQNGRIEKLPSTTILSPAFNLQKNDVVYLAPVYQGIVVQPKDILTIIVSSRYPEMAITFNKPLSSYQAGSTAVSSSYSQRILGYLVDIEGNIDYPVLGKLQVLGLTREQVSYMIQTKLIEGGHLGDAIVTTEFMNFKITVLGEVRSPNSFNIQDDRITILEAIGRAGDLTIYGRRDNVLVTREQNGVISHHRVDLRSATLTQSPAYYLQQNDVVYVEPNHVVAERSGINENRTLGVAISFASVLISLATLLRTLNVL